MNCREFRDKWMNEENEEMILHIETCEECMAWVEENTLGREEVQFLKAVPLPSIQLEDRIMRAIYDSLGSESTTAAKDDFPAYARKNRRRLLHRLRPYWGAIAASVVLAAGIAGVRWVDNSPGQLATNSADQPPSPEIDRQQEEATDNAVVTKANPDTDQGTETTPVSPEPGNETEHALTYALDRKSTVTARENRPPKNKPAAEDANSAVSQPDQPVAQKAQQMPPAEDELTAANILLGPPEQVNAFANETDMTEETAEDTKDKAKEEDASVTVTTFTDLTVAAQTSDLPVPMPSAIPDGFTLQSITLQFDHEESNHVKSHVSLYQSGADRWIRVEVAFQQPVNELLSVPGLFVDKRFFSIGNDQAIAVTYDPTWNEAPAEHAIHFTTTQQGVPMYTVITARGISLNDLMLFAQSLNWLP